MKYNITERMENGIENSISSKQGNGFPYANNPALDFKFENQNMLEHLAVAEFESMVQRVKTYFQNNININDPMAVAYLQMTMMDILNDVQRIEKENKTQLEQLAINIVKTYFNIPEGALNIEAHLGSPNEHPDLNIPDNQLYSHHEDDEEEGASNDTSRQDDNNTPYMNESHDDTQVSEWTRIPSEKEIQLEIHKRQLVNILIQGAAIKGQWVFRLYDNEINTISKGLSDKYGKLMSSGMLPYWCFPHSYFLRMIEQIKNTDSPLNAGRTTIKDFNEDIEPQNSVDGGSGSGSGTNISVSTMSTIGVKSVAVCFPVLVQELIKGVMEWLSRASYSPNKILHETSLNVCDTIENELWDMRLGPTVWNNFMKSVTTQNADIKHIILNDILMLPPEKFLETLKNINTNTFDVSELATSIRKDLLTEKIC